MPSPKRPGLILAALCIAFLTACRAPSPGAAAPSPARAPATHASATQAQATRAPSARATAPGGEGCTPDFCAPASWDTARTATPLPQIPPFAEPLNVVISARSNVPLTAIRSALGDWYPVYPNTKVSVAGLHLECISAEKADVTAGGYVPEQAAWRLGGCVHGNELSIKGAEGHVRLWHQPVPGSESGAWFIAASYETMCLVRDGRLRTVAANEAYAALHPSSAYHCVDGGPATIAAAYPDGYDDGAKAFAAAVTAAARARGWRVSERVVAVPRAARAGEGGVPFGPDASVLTVTRK